VIINLKRFASKLSSLLNLFILRRLSSNRHPSFFARSGLRRFTISYHSVRAHRTASASFGSLAAVNWRNSLMPDMAHDVRVQKLISLQYHLSSSIRDRRVTSSNRSRICRRFVALAKYYADSSCLSRAFPFSQKIESFSFQQWTSGD
jgi:hypothetical protein